MKETIGYYKPIASLTSDDINILDLNAGTQVFTFVSSNLAKLDTNVAISSDTIYADVISKKSRVDINYVFEGDSRVSGGASVDFPYKLSLLSNFANTGNFYNIATAGNVISQIISHYATEAYPYRPNGSINESYLFVLVGINDLYNSSDPDYATLASDLLGYCSTAQGDGFKVILFTTFYRNDLTRTQELARLKFNDLLRQGKSSYYQLIDIEDFFPPAASTLFYSDAVHLTEVGNEIVANYINGLFPLGNTGHTIFHRNSFHDVLTPYDTLKIDGKTKITDQLTVNKTLLLQGQIDGFTYNQISLEASNPATSKWDILSSASGTFLITQGGGYTTRMQLDASGNVNFSNNINTTAGAFQLNGLTTQVTKDGSNNMTFTDANAGTLTLTQLANAALNGATGSFTSSDAKTITVTNGVITAIV